MKAADEETIHILQLQWAIRFSSVDLERVERGGLTVDGGMEELKYRLYEFVRDSNLQGSDRQPHKVPVSTGTPQEFVGLITNEHLKQIKKGLQEAFLAFADNKFFSLKLEGGKRGPSIDWIAFNPLLRFIQTVKVESDDPVSKAVLALGLHVAYSGLTAERIRRCPVDATIFIRERKPQKGREQYCSLTCTRAAATQKYRLKKRQAAGEATAQSPEKPAPKARRETAPRKTKKG